MPIQTFTGPSICNAACNNLFSFSFFLIKALYINDFSHFCSKPDLHWTRRILNLVHKESLIWSQWRQRELHRLHDLEFLLIAEAQPSWKECPGQQSVNYSRPWMAAGVNVIHLPNLRIYSGQQQKEATYQLLDKKRKEKLKLIFQ